MPVELMSAIDEANATSSPANRLVAEEDALLVAAAKARDTRAFKQLVERHERHVFNGSAHNPQSGRRRRCRVSARRDEAGRRLLQAMNQAGARFIAKGVAMKALVEEITGKPARRRRRA